MSARVAFATAAFLFGAIWMLMGDPRGALVILGALIGFLPWGKWRSKSVPSAMSPHETSRDEASERRDDLDRRLSPEPLAHPERADPFERVFGNNGKS